MKHSFFLSLIPLLLFSTPVTHISAQDGASIYARRCIECHGKQGGGTSDYKKPLRGSLALGQLQALIRKTMPEDDPGSLSQSDAAAVAKYVHEFYFTPKSKNVRIEMSRLTVPQYRQSVADLIGSFRPQTKWTAERGAKVTFYKSRRVDSRSKVGERIDEVIDVNFGTKAPLPDKKMDPLEFSILWEGSFLAPETGEYEFLVKTEHSFKLWVNDRKEPLIDAYVKSGDDMEFQATLFLIEGRLYPFRLEFSKANQGVNNKKNNDKFTPKSAYVSLSWKRPHSATEPIPNQYLFPMRTSESFVCTTPFPPDDRSYGWERGTSVSKAWDEATTDAALETVDYISSHLQELAGYRDKDPNKLNRLKEFCLSFAERAFRRPLSNELKEIYIEKQFREAKFPEQAVKRVVLLVLKSPRFLYLPVGKPDSFAVAARMSLAIWNSIPDDTLFEEARKNALTTESQIQKQLHRMMDDSRAKIRMRDFLLTWLQLKQQHDIEKDPKVFPKFSVELLRDMQSSLELFLDSVVLSEKADYRELLLAETIPLNQTLAQYYGVKSEKKQFVSLELDKEKRSGVLTHPYLLTRLAHANDTSPIFRGVFVAKGLLGVGLKPPPDAVTPVPASLHPSLTTRERVILQTKAMNCMICHEIINELGFPLEQFDAVGRFRTQDRTKPVDSSGKFVDRTGKRTEFRTAKELGRYIANSPEAHEAFVEKMFHHLIQQPVLAYGETTLKNLTHEFQNRQFNIRELAAAVIVKAALFDPVEQSKRLTSHSVK